MSKTTARDLPDLAKQDEGREVVVRRPATPTRRHAAYKALWPMAALLLGELLAIALLAPPHGAELTSAALALACAVLLVGIVPALLHPSVATNLVGCSAVVLASVVWRGPQFVNPLAAFSELRACIGDERCPAWPFEHRVAGTINTAPCSLFPTA